MFRDLGHRVFSLGSFSDPNNPRIQFRSGRTEFFDHEFWDQFEKTGGNLHAKRVSREFCRNFDLILINHYPEWIKDNLDAFGDIPVIVRTLGQSRLSIEHEYKKFGDRIRIVRYSQTEVSLADFARTDAVIYFGKYQSDCSAWQGGSPGLTFHNGFGGRNGISFPNVAEWRRIREATGTRLYGGMNDDIAESSGLAPYAEQSALLRNAAFYLYVYTLPTSYTLSFIEALMAGVPVLAPSSSMILLRSAASTDDAWSPERYEIPRFLHSGNNLSFYKNVDEAISMARMTQNDSGLSAKLSEFGKASAMAFFDAQKIKLQWNLFFEKLV